MDIFFFWISLIIFKLVKASNQPNDWIEIDKGSYFQIFSSNLSFWAANKYCQNFSSNLIAITSEKIHDILSTKLAENNINAAWIGLTDFGSEGRFYFISKHKKITTTKWQKSFPRDYRKSADCVLTKKNDTGIYTWIDAHCSEKHNFVCMWMNRDDTQISKLLPHQSHYTNQCPKPFFPVDGDCFWISSENLTWDKGRTKCQSMHKESDLASILTNFQQEYFSALISGNSTAFWIGLNSIEKHPQWVLQQDVTITMWGETEINIEKKPCVYMSGNEHRLGKWYNASCDKNLKVICQTLIKQNSTQSNDSSPVETDMTYDGVLFQKMGCEKPGYTYYHGSCYKLLSDKPVSHDEAAKFCENESFSNKSNHKFQVELVHFDNSGEKYFILSNWRRSVSEQLDIALWLGINGSKSENTTILRIKFSNNSQVPGFEYVPNPKNSWTNMCCKLSLNGIIYVSSCDESSTAITMCKYRLNNFNSKDLDLNRLSATCPPGWALFNSVCFYFLNEIYRSQYEARKKCMKLGAYLPSIDMQQQIFLKDFVTSEIKKGSENHTNFNAWIGLEIIKRSNQNIQYKWINEAPMRYINLKLSPFISEHAGKDKRCALFSADNGLWEVVNCTETNATLICQKPANIAKISTAEIRSTTATTYKTTVKKNSDVISEPGYKLKSEPVTWIESLRRCKLLKVSPELTSNLAVFKQYSEILKLVIPTDKSSFPKQSEYWIGLSGLYDHFDNAFIRWSDDSPMVFQNFQYGNLMNLTGNENCVVMDSNTRKWFAVKCNIKRPYICQISPKSTSNFKNKDVSSDIFDNQVLKCPENFVEYSKKCYHVVEDQILDWDSADRYCRSMISEDYHRTASLASVETTYENSFVYSLLSSNINSNNDTRYWIGERYKNQHDSRQLCTAISGHPDPYIGARWFTKNCSTRLKFVCSIMKNPEEKSQFSNTNCGDGFIEYKNSMGTSCYHFLPHPNSLQEVKHRCNQENPKSHLLSIQSHYHMHFLLSQMSSNGFSRDRAWWLGAEIESHQQLYNWHWYNGRTMRYTIWNKQPVFDMDTIPSGDLCFNFIPVQVDNINKLGMQVELCSEVKDRKLYGICEHILDHEKDMDFMDCLRDVNGDNYEGQVNVTINGRRCVRWDLIKPSKSLTSLMSLFRNDANKHRFLQYHSNECRYIKSMGRQTTFCAIENDISAENAVSLNECRVQLCKNISKTLHHESEIQVHHSNTLVVVFVTLVLFLCIIVCIAMLSWRRWNKGSLFGGYLRRSQFSFLNNQSRGTSFNNPIYRPINT